MKIKLICTLYVLSILGGNFANNPKVSPGTTVRKFNEFFFLTDPDVFVHFAFPDDPDWQLLAAPETIERFVQEPYFRQPFFTNQLQVPTLLPGIQNAQNGISEISIRSLLNNWQGVLTHELYFHKRESILKLPRKIPLNNFVILDRSNKRWKFTIRFPINGVYKLTIYGGVPPNDKEWICDFKLICQTAIEDIQPLPCNTGVVGFGPTNLLENMGIIEPSCKKGTILAKLRQQIYIGFTLTKKLLIRSEMVANKYTPSELQQNVTERITNQKLVVAVSIPEDGEYILRLFAREKESVAEENVCNYFITTDDPRTYRKENALEQKRKKELVIKTEDQKDPNDIEVVIENIDKLAPEDNGNSNKELTKPDFLKMRQESTEATDRRHCSILDTQMAKATKFESELRENSRKAQAVREEVHDTCVHKILEMNQSTVAELKWYRSPIPAIFDTMKAVYLILGEDVDNLNTWDDIHFLLSQLGNNSLLNRVNNFQTTQIREHALEEADNLTQPHDLTSIKSKSPAVGTFYVWVRDLVKLKQEERKGNMKPPKLLVDDQNRSM